MGILKESGIDYYSRFVMAQGYAVPGGLLPVVFAFPPLKRWALLYCALGAKWECPATGQG